MVVLLVMVRTVGVCCKRSLKARKGCLVVRSAEFSLLNFPFYSCDACPNRRQSVKSKALDVEDADNLQLGPKFYVIGFSMGGQHVWSCLKYIPHSYILGDKTILQEAGVKSMGDVEALPSPPEVADKLTSRFSGDVSYFICMKPGQGPVLLADENETLLHPQTGLPK